MADGDGAEVRRPRLGERILTAVSRDPLAVPRRRRLRNDALVATALAALAVVLALTVRNGRAPDGLGWALLLGGIVPLAWRRSRPRLVLLAVVVCVVPYHAADYVHLAAVPGALLALYTVAAIVRPWQTLLIGGAVTGLALTVMIAISAHQGLELLRVSGWFLAVLIWGVDVRTYRQYIASVEGRAERAERTREEEAARRVAEERLRIARDLHDLLAHSITLIGVQTAVASHILTVDPERLDRAAVAKALDDIAGTCRTARAEVRTTLEVLRGEEEDALSPRGESEGPLPGLAALPALARTARARLTLRTEGAGPVPPAVGAAAYRIVQESLTNSVRHAGPEARAAVSVAARDAALYVTVTDEGGGGSGFGTGSGSRSGFGIIGMRERARSVGGTLLAGPRESGGFEVSAVLPLRGNER
ncbi:sensor histidine kinase [Streptomyces paludis]|uniref:sensor histidine kinase n=1 Tax=Streptomyces paludis TaxID=2282738 RepID=UPI001E5B0BBB|nr:histidine kinase [Streptomyces paludis]